MTSIATEWEEGGGRSEIPERRRRHPATVDQVTKQVTSTMPGTLTSNVQQVSDILKMLMSVLTCHPNALYANEAHFTHG